MHYYTTGTDNPLLSCCYDEAAVAGIDASATIVCLSTYGEDRRFLEARWEIVYNIVGLNKDLYHITNIGYMYPCSFLLSAATAVLTASTRTRGGRCARSNVTTRPPPTNVWSWIPGKELLPGLTTTPVELVVLVVLMLTCTISPNATKRSTAQK